MIDHEANVRRLARCLSEISHTLESVDDRHRRVERSLELAREIVPASCCALLEIHDDVSTLYVAPDREAGERTALATKMKALYQLVSGGDEIGRSSAAKPSLALPVMGLDEIIGVLRVESDSGAYDARHLRLLSVIAAQIGSYLSMVRLRERDAARTRDIEAAHDFQRLLAGVVGHDLRNPLGVIMTVAGTLLERTTDPLQVTALQRALRNAQQATNLIADLVDVTESRVSGVIRIAAERGDFAETLEGTVDDLRIAHGARIIDLNIDCERPVPGLFDPTRLTQIVSNLVNNAAIHGEASLPIRVHLYREDEAVVISVRNWGSPIAGELLPSIFDPFKQGNKVLRPHSARGLGLGLYIVDRLTKGHGGQVTVDSDAESGTVFRVKLPVEAAMPAVHAESPHTERPLVMIVDDDEQVRTGLRGILEKRGLEVSEAGNGLDALHLLRGGLRPKLIFLDYSMPVMNGEEFCEQCAQDPALSTIPIVVVSADTASAVKLARSRSLELLRKPVALDQLLAALDRTAVMTKT
jgi:signal transduction histidine kinase/CheY-like chemotaxis protein